MRVKLAYGKQDLQIDIPDNAIVIEPRYVPGLVLEKEQAMAALRNPIGTPPLREMVKETDQVSIVISDMTRPTPNHKLIPWLLEELDHVPRANITIINGTGSHRDNTREELAQMLGKEVLESVKVINNNAFDKNEQTFLGLNSYGNPVYLNKTYCESDFRIVTGFIEPHFFAGFSGGPKGIMPGIAGIETILPFHNAEMIGHPLSTWGILEGNPVQAQAVENSLLCKPNFMFNVALNKDKEITAFFAGDVLEAHRVGCQFVKEHAMFACDEFFDIVITTNSGYPLDQNLYQAGKGLSAARQIIKQGGTIICAVECCDGLPDHGNYAKILQMRRTPQELLDMINEPLFSIFDQWAVQKQALIQIWADVYLYSSLNNEDVRKAMFKPTADIGQTLAELIQLYGTNARIAVLPQGPLTIPYVKDRQSVL
jgi:nickel-dependent lactate racemase